MTTDRTCAPPRATALPERSTAAGRTSAPPADAFSALLGAAAPRTDEAPRKPEPRGDDRPHRENAPPRPEADDAPAATTPEPTAPEATPAPDAAPRLIPVEVFAVQLASPLPPAPTAAPAAEPTTATPALPSFAPATPAGQALAQTLVPAAEEPAAPALPQAVAPAAPKPATPTLPVLAGLTPASSAAADALTEPVTPQPQAPAATAADTPAETALPAPGTGSQQTQSDAQPQEQPSKPAAAAPASAQQAKPAEAPAAPATPTVATAAAPAAPAAPAPTGLERAVPLYRAVETTATLLHVAAERGVTHARLNLKPAELGGIEVRLQSTPQGVSAQLVADSPEAARMLAQASDDLRRQLSERDVTLLSLDVSTQGDERREAAAGGDADGFGDQYRPGHATPGRTHDGEPAATATVPAETTLVLPGGVLVDVLA